MTAGAWDQAPGTSGTYRYYLAQHFDDLGTEFDFVGPSAWHPSGAFLAQGLWDHDAMAVPGWPTQEVRNRLRSNVEIYDPDVLLVMIGINDFLSWGATPYEAAGRVDASITAARQGRPDIDIILAELSPAGAVPDATVTAYNAQLAQLAATRTTDASRIRTVDLNTGWDHATHSYDQLHPTTAGDVWFAERWANSLWYGLGIGGPWVTTQTVATWVHD